MGKLAVIGTFYQRYERTDLLLNRVLIESTRPPDEFWMMCESEQDAEIGRSWETSFPNLKIHVVPTPRNPDNTYSIIPYSNKINKALDETSADYIVYLDNNSTPHIEKYRLMVEALDIHPDWGAVYCSQNRTGFSDLKFLRDTPIADAYCVLNFTQVMHRKTEDRWDLDMKWADPDLADARFFSNLHKSLGVFFPVLLDQEMLDEHHIPDRKAVGV